MAERRGDPAALRSEFLFRLFSFYLRLRFRRTFHAVRMSGTIAELPRDRPVIVFSNHPSWWDPALYIVLADRLFRGRPSFGPMDAPSLARYGFFERLGVFGIQKESASGARRFLEVARHVLKDCIGPHGRAMLWVTAEGEFTDPRQRPVLLRAGIAHLARAMPDALLLPLAIEYAFWNESRPELLLRFGTPIAADASLRPAEWNRLLQDALGCEMDALAADSMSREKPRFRSILRGGAGASLPYDLYRRLRAMLSGTVFSPAHEEEA
jgi:1-acyl-sn-glycerol-3-phosphate acyltransferase